MGSNQNIGCFGFLCILLFVAVAWQAVLYVGIPVALVGAVISAYLFNEAKSGGYRSISQRNGGLVVGAGSAVLFIVSLAGNIFTEDGPFGPPENENAANADKPKPNSIFDKPQLIPVPYQGRWAFDGDCEDYSSDVKIDGDDVAFPELSFSPDRVSKQGDRSITFAGVNIFAGDSWEDAGYQKDSIELEVAEDGQTLWINGSKLTRCPLD